MSGHMFTITESPNLVAVSEYQAKLAKLKPQCSNCGKNLPPKIAALPKLASLQRCADREACRVRSIFRTPAKLRRW
jgi:hypothetical protein